MGFFTIVTRGMLFGILFVSMGVVMFAVTAENEDDAPSFVPRNLMRNDAQAVRRRGSTIAPVVRPKGGTKNICCA